METATHLKEMFQHPTRLLNIARFSRRKNVNPNCRFIHVVTDIWRIPIVVPSR